SPARSRGSARGGAGRRGGRARSGRRPRGPARLRRARGGGRRARSESRWGALAWSWLFSIGVQRGVLDKTGAPVLCLSCMPPPDPEDKSPDQGPSGAGTPAVRAGTPPVRPGAGRYEERGPLGKGSMGEVVLCRDARIGRDVALKRLASK